MRYDHFGTPMTSGRFLGNDPRRDPDPYMVDDSAGGVTYICYADTARRAIRRITVTDGVTAIEWAYGAWDDRAALTYVPINKYIEVAE